MILLRLSKINLLLGDMRIIRDLDFDLEEEEIVGLIGATRAGKSALFDLISGFYKASSGHIYFGSDDITKFSVEKRSRLGITRTFQNGSIFADLSVSDNVKVGFYNFIDYKFKDVLFRSKKFLDEEKKLDEKVDELLETFGLNYYKNIIASDLSYVLQGKLDIARAIACGPKVLLLDRPTNGMNNAEAEEFISMIRIVNQKFKTAVVVIENDIDLLMSVCDRIVVMEYGTVIASDEPVEIKNNQALVSISFG